MPPPPLEPAPSRRLASADRALGWLVLGPLVVLFAAYAVRSLSWRTQHDVPLAIYSAFSRAEFGTAPYAEMFEISFPGTILAHLGIAAVFGYGDFGSMLANLLCLLCIGGLTIVLLQPFGRPAGLAAALLFGVAFFMKGPELMLQRDYFLLLPVVGALVVHTRAPWSPRWRRVTIGLLLGLAVAVKPHAGIALVPIAVADLAGSRARTIVAGLGSYALGLLVPCVAVFAWLVAAGGLAAWQEMSARYLPLYLQMSRDHEVLRGTERWVYLLRSVRELGGHWPWFAPAAVGAFVALCGEAPSTPRARLTKLLLGQAAVFAVYPVFAGQFWNYHWIPLLWCLCLLAGGCLVAPPAVVGRTAALLPKATLLFALCVHPDIVSATKWLRPHAQDRSLAHVDAMAGFLQERLRPGDTVQPLDWTGGAVHAMLVGKARLATRFLYDYHLYHHVSEPFVQELRRRFVTEFTAARPRFVLEITGEDKPWPLGHDTTRSFPELERLLAADYVVAASGERYRIHELRP